MLEEFTGAMPAMPELTSRPKPIRSQWGQWPLPGSVLCPRPSVSLMMCDRLVHLHSGSQSGPTQCHVHAAHTGAGTFRPFFNSH